MLAWWVASSISESSIRERVIMPIAKKVTMMSGGWTVVCSYSAPIHKLAIGMCWYMSMISMCICTTYLFVLCNWNVRSGAMAKPTSQQRFHQQRWVTTRRRSKRSAALFAHASAARLHHGGACLFLWDAFMRRTLPKTQGLCIKKALKIQKSSPDLALYFEIHRRFRKSALVYHNLWNCSAVSCATQIALQCKKWSPFACCRLNDSGSFWNLNIYMFSFRATEACASPSSLGTPYFSLWCHKMSTNLIRHAYMTSWFSFLCDIFSVCL